MMTFLPPKLNAALLFGRLLPRSLFGGAYSFFFLLSIGQNVLYLQILCFFFQTDMHTFFFFLINLVSYRAHSSYDSFSSKKQKKERRKKIMVIMMQVACRFSFVSHPCVTIRVLDLVGSDQINVIFEQLK